MNSLVKAAPNARIPIEVTPESAGWSFLDFRVVQLLPGQGFQQDTGGREVAVVPLSGNGVNSASRPSSLSCLEATCSRRSRTSYIRRRAVPSRSPPNKGLPAQSVAHLRRVASPSVCSSRRRCGRSSVAAGRPTDRSATSCQRRFPPNASSSTRSTCRAEPGPVGHHIVTTATPTHRILRRRTTSVFSRVLVSFSIATGAKTNHSMRCCPSRTETQPSSRKAFIRRWHVPGRTCTS